MTDYRETGMIAPKPAGAVLWLWLALLCLAGPLASAASPARANTVFTFAGDCTDCEGARGELTVTDYTPGQTLASSNLVSFAYYSSVYPNGLFSSSLSLTANSVSASPYLPSQLGVSNIDFAGVVAIPNASVIDLMYAEFATTASGSWGLGVSPLSGFSPGEPITIILHDFGSSYSWSYPDTAPVAPSPAPELATWALTIMGFGAIGIAIRRQRRVNLSFASNRFKP